MVFVGYGIAATFICEGELGLRNIVPSLAIVFLGQILYAVAPFLLIKKVPEGANYALALKVVGPLVHCLLNIFKDSNGFSPKYGFLATINYDFIFMAQGMIDQLYAKEIQQSKNYFKDSVVVPLSFISFFLFYSLTCPTPTDTAGFLYYYPLYDQTWHQNLHVGGSWLWIISLIEVSSAFLNKQFGENNYKLLVDSSFYVYLTHYLWIAIIGRLLI